ncbi:MAG: RAMP superfamily CRISPR-associated protein, partial [Bacteroidota bacterium]
MKLQKKLILTGYIKAETGLHIGGTEGSLDIGGMNNPVIKTINDMPYIPGSSLKGKLRSLLARAHGSKALTKRDLKKESSGTTDDDIELL